MAAKVLESPNKVWQRVNILLQGARPETRAAFQALKMYLATQGGNPPLQLVLFSNVGVQQPMLLTTGGGTVYAIFAKKSNTATASYLKINDSATLAGGAAGINMKAVMPLAAANAEGVMSFMPGFALVTGLTVAAETTPVGGTSSVAGDGPNGFAIIG